jgi:hypothetical protein
LFAAASKAIRNRDMMTKDFNSQNIANTVLSFAMAKVTDVPLFNISSKAVLDRDLMNTCNLQDLSCILIAFLFSGIKDIRLFDAASRAILSRDLIMKECTSSDISHIIGAFAGFGINDEQIFTKCIEAIKKRDDIKNGLDNKRIKLIRKNLMKMRYSELAISEMFT